MKRLAAAFCVLFLAVAVFPLHAQTVANPSFELNAATLLNGNSWEVGQIPGWTVTGSAGLWQPPTQFSALPDGKTVLFLNGATVAQDLGVTAAACGASCTFTVSVGNRSDGPSSSYTLALNAGSVALCTLSGSNAEIPRGTFVAKTQTCPVPSPIPSGNLVVSLTSAGAQVQFDTVAVRSALVPQPDSITVKAQLLWCALCDGTDNVPATGNLVVSQTGGPSSTQNISADGTVTVGGTVDVAQDPLEFTVQLTDANGLTQAGAAMTWKFPRFELASATFLVKTVSLGIVRIAHTVDANGDPAVRLVDVSGFSIGK